jgi:hypothetical protein
VKDNVEKARATKADTNLSAPRANVVLWLAVLVGVITLTIGLNILLPKQYRACSLMPGYCSKKTEEPKGGPFEEIGKLRPGAAKFGLTDKLSKRY